MTTTERPCPRCGATAPMTRYAVCVPCTAAEGWDPPCEACNTEGRGGDPAGLVHVPTCGGPVSTFSNEGAR